MPYIVIHQNPVDQQYIRNKYCGDIVVFHISRDIELDEYVIDEYNYPEYDNKIVIKNKEWRDYINTIGFPYDEVDDTNCLRHTRWCESDMIRYFNSFIEMYDHVIVMRRYTVFHHINAEGIIQYFYEEKKNRFNSPSSALTEQ